MQWKLFNRLISISNFIFIPKERHDFTEIAKRLLLFCEYEVDCILNCAKCYENKRTNPDEWRTIACDWPHLLLWAKLPRSTPFWPAKKGVSFWPAKLLAIMGNDIKVVFFDHAEFEVIPATNCFLYSSTDPSLTYAKADPRDIKDALNVKNIEFL